MVGLMADVIGMLMGAIIMPIANMPMMAMIDMYGIGCPARARR